MRRLSPVWVYSRYSRLWLICHPSQAIRTPAISVMRWMMAGSSARFLNTYQYMERATRSP